MDIDLQEISIRSLTENYQDNQEKGVIGYNGKLDIRPPYQREFIYNEKQRAAVITTINNKFPLNVMYWAKREDGSYEVIDGQQRTISICQYVAGDFSYDFQYFHNLTEEEKKKILDYKLMVYICSGTDKEKLDWFKTINIAGEKLTEQELRNAVYAGSFVTDAKRYFSKNNCPAQAMAKDYLNGSAIRQEYFETALRWMANSLKITSIEGYMAIHQHDPNANQLWQYFNAVITWITSTFDTKWKRIMKGLDWGSFYDKYHLEVFDREEMSERITKLMADGDVENKKGIIPFILTGDEKYLSIRTFPEDIKISVYTKQKGICKICGKPFDIEFMEADHITPWSQGGKTTIENCQMLCRECNRRKSDK